MNPGKMNRLINIRTQVVSTARSTDGEPLITITTASSNIWVRKEPLTGREYFTMDQRYYDADVRFIARFTTNITEKSKIYDVYTSEVYEVKMLKDKDDRHRELMFLGKLIK